MSLPSSWSASLISSCEYDQDRRHTSGLKQSASDVFSELKGKNLLLSGESYSGFYVPYIANYIYENTTSETFPLNLKGIWIADPSTSYDVVQEQIPGESELRIYECN